jgi:hypothetical protein
VLLKQQKELDEEFQDVVKMRNTPVKKLSRRGSARTVKKTAVNAMSATMASSPSKGMRTPDLTSDATPVTMASTIVRGTRKNPESLKGQSPIR